jgi:outer membrane lipoprotein LolB
MSRNPSFMRWWHVSWLLPLLLAACATLPSVRPPLSADQQRDFLQSLDAFSFTGRVRVAIDGRDSTASIEWVQRRNDVNARLTSMLGVGGIRIQYSPERLQLETGDQVKYRDGDAEQLLVRELGFVPPFGVLRYWALGLPVPELSADANTDAARMQLLARQGWQLTYEQYTQVRTAAGEMRLPHVLIATRDGLRLRLVIDRWRIK